jgi:hypothetical protein
LGVYVFDSISRQWCGCFSSDFLRRGIMVKETVLFVVFMVFFIGALCFTSIYEATLRQECRQLAMEQRYSPVEVQVMCKL